MQFFPGEVLSGGDGVPREQVLQQSSEFSGDVLALCPQVVSQASQHFRSSEKQATCEGCFARKSICSVVSLHSGMSRAVHPQEFSKVDVDH